MYSKDPTFTVYLHDAPRIFGELATELEVPLVTLESGVYEIEKGGFTLRISYAPPHPWPDPQSADCAVALSPTRIKNFGGRSGPGSPVNIRFVVEAFGRAYRHESEFMAAKIKKARDTAKEYCVPIMTGDVASWDKVVGYINKQWELFLIKKANPDAAPWR